MTRITSRVPDTSLLRHARAESNLLSVVAMSSVPPPLAAASGPGLLQFHPRGIPALFVVASLISVDLLSFASTPACAGLPFITVATQIAPPAGKAELNAQQPPEMQPAGDGQDIAFIEAQVVYREQAMAIAQSARQIMEAGNREQALERYKEAAARIAKCRLNEDKAAFLGQIAVAVLPIDPKLSEDLFKQAFAAVETIRPVGRASIDYQKAGALGVLALEQAMAKDSNGARQTFLRAIEIASNLPPPDRNDRLLIIVHYQYHAAAEADFTFVGDAEHTINAIDDRRTMDLARLEVEKLRDKAFQLRLPPPPIKLMAPAPTTRPG